MTENAEEPQPLPLYQPPAEPKPTTKLPTSTLLLGAGGLLLLLSAFMPWIKVLAFSLSGVDTDWGLIAIVAGVAAIIAAAGPRVFASEKAVAAVLSLTGILAVFAIIGAIYVGFAVRDSVAKEESSEASSPSNPYLGEEFEDALDEFAEAFKPTTGTGVYAAVIGGVVVLAGTVVAGRER